MMIYKHKRFTKTQEVRKKYRTPVFKEQIYFDFSKNTRSYEKQAEYLAIPKAKYK